MNPNPGHIAAITDDGIRPDRVAPTPRWIRLRRVLQWLGLAGQPCPAIVLFSVVLAAALGVVVVGVNQPVELPSDGLPLVARVGIAAALAAAAQLARLRFRLGSRTVSLAGGEVAFILGFAVIPAGWLPAATLLGATAAWVLISVLNDHRPPAEVMHVAASLTLAVAGASAVTSALAGPDSMVYGFAEPWPAALTARFGLALLAGCGTQLIINVCLSVVTLALHRDVPMGLAIARTLHGKLPVFVGNVLVGLFALLALHLEPGWLLLVPPAMWLLRRTYCLHLRAEDERRLWSAFAQATRTLGGPAERDVVVAGMRGAQEVFGAQRVEIVVTRPDGPSLRWVSDGDHLVIDGAAADGEEPSVGRPRPAGLMVTQPLTVFDALVGELTLWLPPTTAWATRDGLAISAYGDELASALHAAATRHGLAALSARASHDAMHDPLTGLPHRATLLSEGDQLLRSIDRDSPVALLLLDLNGFRQVNATLGQAAGDELLTVVGARLGELAREHDMLARLGDDEFALLVPQVAVLSDSATPLSGTAAVLPQAIRRAQELIKFLHVPTEIAGIRLAIEAAVGVVVSKAGCCDLAELVRRAEIALGEAKRTEVAVVAYDDEHETASTDHLAMLAELRDALAADDQIVMALQPAVDLETGVPTGVEALSRWRHPRRGHLSPIEFIRVVERSELLGPFTRYVLDRSLAAAAAWSAAGLDLPVSVNVAARTLLDSSFPAQVAEALRRHSMPSKRLVLEITETVAVSDQPIVDDVVSALRQLGVQLSVDDFGTGYSSLAFLNRMPVDELKVDRSFVAGMGQSARAAAIVRFAVDLGRRLDLRVVAEGVETADQRSALLELGCTSAQGYHFCKPMPADKIVEALLSLNQGATTANVVPLRADGAS